MKLRKAPGEQPLLNEVPIGLQFFEDRFREHDYIAGVDEAGRGCLAGPVVAASVILPKGIDIAGLKDSKQLSPLQRAHFYDVILEKSLTWSVGVVGAREIDRINILRASLKAMQEAVSGLKIQPDLLLIDGLHMIESKILQKTLKKGDARSISIAAASVIAKVTRDKMMGEYAKSYPNYSFSVHKGYGTALHLKELRLHGPTPIHRMTFAPLNEKQEGVRKMHLSF